MKLPLTVCVGLLLLAVSSPAAAAKTWCFDMGTAQSDVRPGFVRITAKSVYSPATGYGWKSTQGLKEQYEPCQRQWKDDASRESPQPPPIYANELTCDSISSTQPNAFLVDLPRGAYTVYVLCGRSAGSRTEYHDFDVAVGGVRATVKIPGPYRFEKCVLKASVGRAPLAVELAPRSDWVVAGLIVYPTAAERQVRADFLDALEKEIWFLPPDVAAKWHEIKHVDDRPLPPLSPLDRRRGYALFARHYSEVIFPNTVPRESELNPQLEIFAAWGQREAVTFSVLPLADLQGAKVTAGPLSYGDAVIPAANIDVRYVRYMLVRPNYSTYFTYYTAPDVLEHRESVDIPRGSNQRFWITVQVPDDAAPGVYTGRLTFSAQGTDAAEVPLRVRVLPIHLRTNPDHIYGMYYYDPLSLYSEKNTPQANAYFQRKAELERADMVAHGMNTHTSDIRLDRDPQGGWSVRSAEFQRRLDLDRKYGLAGKPLVVHFPAEAAFYRLVDKRGPGNHLRLVQGDVPPAVFEETTRVVETIERERQKQGWPEFLYYPIDEPGVHDAAIKFMVEILQACRRVPGIRTYLTADPSEDHFAPLWPFVDVWCCQPFVFDHDAIARMSREKRVEFWCYPNHISGENDHTPIRGARMTWGFGFWKSGFKALIPWIYQSSSGDPWNYLDGSSMDFFVRSTPEGEPIPVAMWEAFREGIDDGRYIYTLEQLVQEGRGRGGRAAELAQQGARELKFVWDAFAPQEKYKFDGLWSGRDFDAYRWLLAARILELQEALK